MRKKKVVEVQTPKTKEELRSLVIKRVTECENYELYVSRLSIHRRPKYVGY